jgi:hypothetical protein
VLGTNKIHINSILEAALVALQPGMGLPEDAILTTEDLEWEAWPQSWGSTALGYGGIGGRAFTKAQTVIVYSNLSREVAVFFGGRHLAYIAHVNSPSYQQAYQNRNLPPAYRANSVRN